MRRLTDVTISSDDRPAPPRLRSTRTERPRRATGADAPRTTAAEPAPRPRRRAAARPGRRRLRFAATLAIALAALGAASFWAMRSGVAASARATIGDALVGLSLRAGLRVEAIAIEGRKRIADQDLRAALGIAPGDPILGIDLAAAQARVASLPGVKSVAIARRLPGAVEVEVAEREPIAIWQNDGKFQLVDADGKPAGDNVEDFAGLPLVVGAGAPGHTAELLAMLAAEKDLAPRVKASQWLADRRWNVIVTGLAGDIEVRLPSDDPAAAWHDLAQLEADQKLLERKVTMVDLRLPDRLVVRVPGGIEQTEKTPAARRKAPGRDA